MKLRILGTGNASVVECFNSCFIFSEEHRHFLIDAGGGNRILKVLKDANIPLEEIHDIFITHEHIDHLLGVVWLIRMIGTKINQGKYEGVLKIYCHEDLVNTIDTIVKLTIVEKLYKLIGNQIQLIAIKDGERKEILDRPITFFDIHSTKAKQFGFSMIYEPDCKFTYVGDEPYNEMNYENVKDSKWLLHEAFCLFSQADKFKPYEKHHSTVKEACQLAERLSIPNLILFHTEEVNLSNRKELYTTEGKEYYNGNLYVPDDMEVFESL